MASIICKKRGKRSYYYYVESSRINGKPRITNQKYLGTAETILEKISSKRVPALYSRVLDFGDVTLLYDIAIRLGVSDIINQHIHKRDQGLSIGDYIVIAAINRAVSPTSKSGLQAWFERTILTQIMNIDTSLLTSQNYWNNLDFSKSQIDGIEECLVKKIVDTYDINTTHLIYDATNFFTYIDTKQDSEYAKRGHSKEKRNDLRIVGLSMMVSPDHSIPLLYDTYPGNRSDAKQFTEMLNKLRIRYQRITNKKADITVVFDRGNNADYNMDLLEDEDFPMHYVGGLKRNQCNELFLIPATDYLELSDIEKSCAVRTQKEVYGRKMTIVVVYNQNLFNGQMQGVTTNIEKTLKLLSELQLKLELRLTNVVTKGKKPTVASVTKQVNHILTTEFMNDIFTYTITTKDSDLPQLEYNLDYEALETLKSTVLGKNVLFTNRHEWTNEEIVSAYRSAWHIEHAFRQMKDTSHLNVRPIFHWTDEKIEVHIFYCVLAYRLCCILKKELDESGIKESLNYILNDMHQYKYVITVTGCNKNDIFTSLTQPTTLTSSIIQKYNLEKKYLSNVCV